MGADPAGDRARGSCGLVSSLFPNSCRGRAEAFARRLHRRLTSLGNAGAAEDDEADGSADREPLKLSNSWLTHKINSDTASGPVQNHVHEQQPRHSPESDLYYDFDLSPDHEADPDSPGEVVSVAELAHLLVNHSQILTANHVDACHCAGGPRPTEDLNLDPESGYVFSSPLDATPTDEGNSAEAYFDPESSETDKTHTDDFFDPLHSDSDRTRPPTPPGRRRVAANEAGNPEETSESSLSLNGATAPEEESLNEPLSSLDTTSPSHESLWSTFDDSTVSQDDNPTISQPDCLVPKSYSDSELIPRGARLPDVQVNSLDEVDFIKKSVENGQAVDKLCLAESVSDDGSSTYNSTIDIPGALVVECPVDESPPVETLRAEVCLTVTDCEEIASEDMAKLLQKIDRTSEQTQNVIEEDGAEEEEEEEEEEEVNEEAEKQRPQRLRRCSSLKTGKTPPGTPGRKKIVRFADVLGLDLADVRTFLDEIPKVPNSAYSDLSYDDAFAKDGSPGYYENLSTVAQSSGANGLGTSSKPNRMLVPLFQQPGSLPNFLDLVRDRQVCLENVVVQDPVAMCIQGTVRVRNLDFHKSVHVRYSLDSWRNFSDLQALYVANSCDGFSDKFTFQLYCHTLRVGERVEIAVRFQCKGTQYWDNNGGTNYCFQCLPTSPAVSYIPIIEHNNSRDWSPTFY